MREFKSAHMRMFGKKREQVDEGRNQSQVPGQTGEPEKGKGPIVAPFAQLAAAN